VTLQPNRPASHITGIAPPLGNSEYHGQFALIGREGNHFGSAAQGVRVDIYAHIIDLFFFQYGFGIGRLIVGALPQYPTASWRNLAVCILQGVPPGYEHLNIDRIKVLSSIMFI
jgi:hypothetical protein